MTGVTDLRVARSVTRPRSDQSGHTQKFSRLKKSTFNPTLPGPLDGRSPLSRGNGLTRVSEECCLGTPSLTVEVTCLVLYPRVSPIL